MRRTLIAVPVLVLGLLWSCDNDDVTRPDASDEERITRSYAAVQELSFEVVSGHVRVQAGATDCTRVELAHTYSPVGVFKPEFIESDGELTLRETFDGGTVNGYSDWTVTCVPGTRIRFTSASGDLQVTSPVSDLRATTASGEVTIAAADGDMRITMRVVEWLLHGRRHSYLLSQ